MTKPQRTRLELDVFYGQHPREWTLNPFKPRFYIEWHYRTELDASIRVVKDEFHHGWVNFVSFWRNRGEFDVKHRTHHEQIVKLQLAYVTNNWPIEIASPSAILEHKASETSLLGKNYESNSRSLAPTSENRQLSEYGRQCVEEAKQSLSTIAESTPSKQQELHSLIMRTALPVEWKRNGDLIDNLKQRIEPNKDSAPLTVQALYNAAPAYMCMKLWDPTPSHFSVISLKQVIGESYGIDEKQFATKATSLQITIWICLFMAAAMVPFIIKFFMLLLISLFVSDISFVQSFFQLVVTSCVFCLSIFGYVSYSHFFFEYCVDRFTSYRDYFQFIRKNPLALLPMERFIKIHTQEKESDYV